MVPEWLEKRLMEEGEGEFEVSDGKVLRPALVKQGFGLEDLDKPERLKQLSQSMNGLPAMAKGEVVRSRAGRVVTMQCRLIQTESDDLAGSAGGVALLNASEWAMLGRSASLSPCRATAPGPVALRHDAEGSGDDRGREARRESKGPHPMTDPNFEFPVPASWGRREDARHRQGQPVDRPLRKGETYELYVGNRARPAGLHAAADRRAEYPP